MDKINTTITEDIARAMGGYTSLSSEVPFKEVFKMDEKDSHYDNSNGSLYLFAENQGLNSWEFDIIKRIVRCRRKGQFEEDLLKTKRVIDLYLEEYSIK